MTKPRAGRRYPDLSFELQRNDTYQETWALTEYDEAGEPVPMDLTGRVLEMQFRRIGGHPSVVLTLVETPSNASSGLHVAIPRTQGLFQVTFEGADFGALGASMEAVKAVWDLRITEPNGLAMLYARGVLTLTPGATL